ncbi:hypothetical protein CR513_50505, partial [Mucuna pruriens]
MWNLYWWLGLGKQNNQGQLLLADTKIGLHGVREKMPQVSTILRLTQTRAPSLVVQVKFLIVVVDYFTKWVEAKPVATSQLKGLNGSTRKRSYVALSSQNEEEIRANLDLLQEAQEISHIKEFVAKARATR